MVSIHLESQSARNFPPHPFPLPRLSNNRPRWPFLSLGNSRCRPYLFLVPFPLLIKWDKRLAVLSFQRGYRSSFRS